MRRDSRAQLIGCPTLGYPLRVRMMEWVVVLVAAVGVVKADHAGALAEPPPRSLGEEI